MQNPEKELMTIGRRGGRRPGAGRPLGSLNKLTRPLKELAAQYGPDALRTLVSIMNNGESETTRIAAAKALLDRGYGRPSQQEEAKDQSVRVIICDPTRPPRPALADRLTDNAEPTDAL